MALRVYGTIPEQQDATAIARVCTQDNVALQPGDVDHWHLNIYDMTSRTPNTPIYTVNDQYTDPIGTLTVDSSWVDDAIGYNFKQTIGRSLFGSVGGHTYHMIWTLETYSNNRIIVAAVVKVERMMPS